MSVIDVVITSSPGPIPAAATAICSAAVPEEQTCACSKGKIALNRSMNSVVCGPFQYINDVWSTTFDNCSRSSSPHRTFFGAGPTAFGPPSIASFSGDPSAAFRDAPAASAAVDAARNSRREGEFDMLSPEFNG